MATERKKRDPNIPGDWPVRDYPFMVERPYEPHPKYFPSHPAALKYMQNLLKNFRARLELYDKDVPLAVEHALGEVGRLPLSGGRVDRVVAPYTGTRFTATLVKRIEL